MIDMTNAATTNGYHRSCSPSTLSGSSSPNLVPNKQVSGGKHSPTSNGSPGINRGMRVVMSNSHNNMVK